MAQLKMQRYPKKPKASASVATLQNFISKCKDIDRTNAKRKAENSKKLTLRKKVAGIRQKN